MSAIIVKFRLLYINLAHDGEVRNKLRPQAAKSFSQDWLEKEAALDQNGWHENGQPGASVAGGRGWAL